ncbi:hypothetical protein [Novosphingobium sp. FSW06-99]|uniref:hypothetical protein n=1 Tax=Novosphingobium sp. FSW06-99 TaxID=1739113 RepID=UPI00076CECC9|nr:hypothetical protein [Novosphingobium sp. FSW06-99]KUR76906.1 hypothetical protein AQZ49_11345 [Novosphingobium sp. FSW06-99]
MRAAVFARVVMSLSLGVLAVPALGQGTGQAAQQANPPDPVTAESTVAPALPADPAYHGGPYAGALTPPPAAAMGKTYPVCTRTLRDGCTNRGPAHAHRAP